MIDQELLKVLVCPKDQTALDIADDQLLAMLNQAIVARNVQNQSGQTLEQPIAGGLVRKDGKLLYPIVNDIPVLLIDEAISLDQIP